MSASADSVAPPVEAEIQTEATPPVEDVFKSRMKDKSINILSLDGGGVKVRCQKQARTAWGIQVGKKMAAGRLPSGRTPRVAARRM
jgi:hypothetical protein